MAWLQDCAALPLCLADTFTREVAAVALSAAVAHPTCCESQRKVRAGLAGIGTKTGSHLEASEAHRKQKGEKAKHIDFL